MIFLITGVTEEVAFVLGGHVKGTMSKCPACGYPVMANIEGETAVCANCGQQMESYISQGITFPTGFVTATVFFILGALLGPTLVASTASGKAWLERRVKQ